MGASPRNACLDAVASCDAFVLIVGARGGWTAPSGKLVVEEEHQEALRRGLPVLLFIERGPTDSKAKALIQRLSDYLGGLFRTEFEGAASLESAVFKAVTALQLGGTMRNACNSDLLGGFESGHGQWQETTLHYAIVPERDEQVFTSLGIESPDLRNTVMEVAHRKGVGLLSYEHPKVHRVELDRLVVCQAPDPRSGRSPKVILETAESGLIRVRASVSGLVERNSDLSTADSLQLSEEVVCHRLEQCVSLSLALYDEIDPYRRHFAFWTNAALSDLGSRLWVDHLEVRKSYSVPQYRHNGPHFAFDRPQRLTRDQMRQPAELAREITARMRRASLAGGV